MLFLNKFARIFSLFSIIFAFLVLYNWSSAPASASSDCPTVELDGSIYTLDPCSINMEMIDGQGGENFQFKIVQSGISRPFSFTVYGYGEGFPTYAILGISSGGANPPEVVIDESFNDKVLDSDGASLRVYTGYLPIRISHGGESAYRELRLNITLTVKPGDNQTNNQNSSASKTTTLPNSSTASPNEAYKSIVKIKTFVLDNDSELVKLKEGSGIIISSDGLVLTNYHVVGVKSSFDNKEEEAIYQICLPMAIDKEPECIYTGLLIAANDSMDIALLKIKPIPDLSNTSEYPYLELNNVDNTNVGDQITILGYPSIGGDTVTLTQGVVSGKLDRYGKSWIKTDTVVSYGNSGGAAIDSSGKVVGITTQAYSDMIGSLGYLINIASIKLWIDNNTQRVPQASALESKLIDYTKKEKQLESSNTFTNAKPPFQITKEAGWSFTYFKKGSVTISKKGDENSGRINIVSTRFPYKVSFDDALALYKRSANMIGIYALLEIVKQETVKINDVDVRKVTVSTAGKTFDKYFALHREYVISLEVGYGENNQDKTAIERMINTFKLLPFNYEMKKDVEYTHSNPSFYIKEGQGWYIQVLNDKSSPIEMYRKENPDVYAQINIYKVDKGDKIDNNVLKQKETQSIQQINQLGSLLDYKVEILSSDTNYNLGGKYKNIFRFETVSKVSSSGKALVYDLSYYIPYKNEMYITPSLSVYTENENDYKQAKSWFDDFLLSNFVIGDKAGSIMKSTAPSMGVKKVRNTGMYRKLKGKILLKVESKGEAYYVHPQDGRSYYLGRPKDAFDIMKNLGIGITNKDLSKIPVAIYDMSGKDTDGDGFSDAFEDAIGTDKYNQDTDGDGYTDKDEVANGYSPLGSGKIKVDKGFVDKHLGKIFLQVEGKGEAWYINPDDGKRYFLGRPHDAFKIMRDLGLGISNKDFDEFTE